MPSLRSWPHQLSIFPFHPRLIRGLSSAVSSDRLKYLLKIMPKDKSVAPRAFPRIDPKLTSPPEAYIQIIGDGSSGSPSSVMLITSGTRYLFNCGEGTQRFVHEHKLQLSQVKNIFFTTRSWSNIGGLPGLSLTAKDMGKEKLTLHGPEGIGDIYEMAKRFMQVTGMEVEQTPLSSAVFSDHAVSIRSIPLLPDVQLSDLTISSRKRRRSGSPTDGPVNVAVAYIGKITDKPGTLMMEKVAAYRVSPGPWMARLKDGHDVTLYDGRIVKAADVCMPDSPGPVFMVVECPTEEHVSSLLADPFVKVHQKNAEKSQDVMEVVIHFTPSHVMQSKRYLEWMDLFSPSTHHLIVNDSNFNANTVAPYRMQAQLNMLDESLFPLLPAQQNPPPQRVLAEVLTPQGVLGKAEDESLLPVMMHRANPLMSFYLRPARRLVAATSVRLDNEEYRNEALVYEGLKEAVEEYRKDFPTVAFCDSLDQPDVTFLGTGSAIPNKVRNVSGILLRVNKDCSILMDCGEGTAGQMVRFFGPQKWEEEMRRLRAVYLSHGHADHHLGLIDVIRLRKESYQRSGDAADPLIVFTPEPIVSFLEVFSAKFAAILDDIQIVDCAAWHTATIPTAITQEILLSLHMQEIKITPVFHCHAAFGLALTATAGWKICYSGDTMPCSELVDIGRDCDLLIHEATMEDMMEEDARRKRHSTMSQAVQVGRDMNARFTMLTHFSQRYAKIPLLKTDYGPTVGIAFDNMRVRLGDLQKIPPMLPALKLMFTEHVEEMQARSDKLANRWELEKRDAERRDAVTAVDGTAEAENRTASVG